MASTQSSAQAVSTSLNDTAPAEPGRLTVTPPKQASTEQKSTPTKSVSQKPKAPKTEKVSTKPAKISASAALEKLIQAPKGRVTVTPDQNATAPDTQTKQQPTNPQAQQPATESVLDAELSTPSTPRLTTTPPAAPPPRKRRQTAVPEVQPDQPPQALAKEGDKAKTKITLTREQLEALLRQQQLMSEQKAADKKARAKKPSDAFYEFLADQDEPAE